MSALSKTQERELDQLRSSYEKDLDRLRLNHKAEFEKRVSVHVTCILNIYFVAFLTYKYMYIYSLCLFFLFPAKARVFRGS